MVYQRGVVEIQGECACHRRGPKSQYSLSTGDLQDIILVGRLPPDTTRQCCERPDSSPRTRARSSKRSACVSLTSSSTTATTARRTSPCACTSKCAGSSLPVTTLLTTPVRPVATRHPRYWVFWTDHPCDHRDECALTTIFAETFRTICKEKHPACLKRYPILPKHPS